MNTRYIAVMIASDGHPVQIEDDTGKMAVWDDYETARRETAAMPIAAKLEIRILDLSAAC